MRDTRLLLLGAFAWVAFAIAPAFAEKARPAPEQGGSHFGGSVPVCVCAEGRGQ